MSKTLTFIADFNTSVLARAFAGHPAAAEYSVEERPYAELIGTLAGLQSEPDVASSAFVWARAQAVSALVARAMAYEPVGHDECLADVDVFADALVAFASRHAHCFVVAFSLSPNDDGYGVLDWRPGLGLASLIARMNMRLAERLAASSNVYLLDPGRWFASVAAPAPPKLWYAAKLPFANAVFQHAAADLQVALDAVAGRARRLVFVDLDDTLWGGVVGETGWEGIRLGGHDHVGEAFASFQEALKGLTRRGVQVAVVSKNEERVALAAIDQHPSMALRRGDLAGWRINWQDKAQNIGELLEELNLGPASAVFIDDNPVERDRVRQAYPEILTPEWSSDPSLSVASLRALRCFDTPVVSAEDRARTQMYVADRGRRDLQGRSMDEWLAKLGTTVRVEAIAAGNVLRVEQLLNKTNQLNLSTRRLSGAELTQWASQPGRICLACSVADRFGELGLTGIVSVEAGGSEARLVDYVLSCRVMGRRVEETLLHLAVDAARRLGALRLTARYFETPRNAPTLKVFRASGFDEQPEQTFSWDCRDPFPKPESVAVEIREPAS